MAKYLTLSIILLLGLMAYFTYKLSFEPEKMLPPANDEAVSLEAYNFQNWKEYSSPNGDFKVLLPTLPQHATENSKDPKSNEPLKYDMYVSEKGDGSIFMISVISNLDSKAKVDPDSRMKRMIHDMAAANKTYELNSIKNGTYDGHDSMDYVISNDKLRIDGKTFMVGNKQYILSRVVQNQNYNPKEYNFFVNSFELEPSTTKKKQEKNPKDSGLIK